MTTLRFHALRQALAGMVLMALTGFAPQAGAQATVALTPNLIPLPAADFSLITSTTGTSTLRFSTTSWNDGTGPLQVEAGPVDTGSGKQQVYQRVFNDDGTSALFAAGWVEWHPTHNHFHFDDYAYYTLQPINAPGGSQRTGAKTTFCIMDTTKIDGSLPGAPTQAAYSSCGSLLQGMSIGWGDTYGSHLPGQEIDFTSNADGIYQLKIAVDPAQKLVEADENDNESCVLLSIRKPNSVTVLDGSGSCALVTSIAPNSARVGTSVAVAITGYGFTPGMAVTFDRGTGPRPAASNVVLVNDTDGLDTITAIVTVPPRRKLGRDPIWDLRVGTGSILSNAFTVLP